MMTIKGINYSVLLLLVITICSCGGESISETYRLNKPYWDVKDYDNAIYRIRYTKDDEKKPSYQNKEKAQVFIKLIDRKNIDVILNDKELGISHKSNFATEMFEQYKKMADLYRDTDREDNYLYSSELVDVMKFGLHLQLQYFDLGNKEILQNADDPNEPYIVNLLRSNEGVVVSNYCNYLSYVKEEKFFSSEARVSFINGINDECAKIITQFPDANFSEMREKANLMMDKTESKEIKEALTQLLSKLEESKKKKNEEEIVVEAS